MNIILLLLEALGLYFFGMSLYNISTLDHSQSLYYYLSLGTLVLIVVLATTFDKYFPEDTTLQKSMINLAGTILEVWVIAMIFIGAIAGMVGDTKVNKALEMSYESSNSQMWNKGTD